MKQVIKITTIISLCFILIGIGLAGSGYMLGGSMDWSYLPSSNRFFTEKNAKHKIIKEDLDAFTNIDLACDAYDIVITQGDSYSVSYPEYNNIHTTYSIENDTLKLESKSEHTVNFSLSGTSNSDYALVLTIPSKQALNEITLKSCSGDIELSHLNFDHINGTANYGDIILSHLSGNALELTADDGDVTISNTELTSGNFVLNYGDFDISSTSVSDFTLANDSGDFSAEKFTSDTATLNLHYGDADAESSTIMNLTATLDSGDCDLELKGRKSDYSLDLTSDTDDIEVDDEDASGHYNYVRDTPKAIQVSTHYGSISLSFTH